MDLFEVECIEEMATQSKDSIRKGFLDREFQNGELLIYGDNLPALHMLLNSPSVRDKIRLVYIDPPFGTQQAFRIGMGRVATISRENGGAIAYRDDLSGEAYLRFLKQRLQFIRDVMADDGSIYVHIDCKIGHYVKRLMDEVFGQKNFVNDITRIKCNPKNFDRKGYGNIKDMILFYSKTSKFVWQGVRQAIEILEEDARFRLIDAQGKHYTTTPLHAPGETANGPTGKPWRNMKPPPGRHWRYPPQVLETLDRQGLVEWSSTGNPRKKIYAEDVERAGVKIQDVWTFKDPQSPVYPTEKNLEMIKTIVANSSQPGDIVVDAFCGSGTTLLAARALGRRWIGIDESPMAIAVAKKRLPGCTFLSLQNLRLSLAHERVG